MRSALICVVLASASFTLAQQPAASTPQKSLSSYMGLHTFPAKSQTAAQQQKDELACYDWAKQDSGFDPLESLVAQQQAPATESAETATPEKRGLGAKGVAQSAAGGAAGGAAIGAVGGAIAGNAGKGAAIGAASGAMGGPLMAKIAEKQAQKQAQQQQQQAQQQRAREQAEAKADTQQKFEGFKKGFSACMEAKNYVVK